MHEPAPAAPATIALVGCGRWGANVLRDLRALGCEVWVVARSASSRERAAQGGAAGIAERISDLPPVAGAVVCTPISTHHAVIRQVAAAQAVPIFTEKPLTDDPATADGLAADLGGRLFVMDKWRYHPAVRELARIARTGELGPVQGLHCRRVTRGHRYDDVDTVVVHAPHDLAIALEILGDLPPAASATAEHAAGMRVGLIGALGGPPWVTLEVSCVAPEHRRELRLTCRDGVAYLDGGWSEELHIVRDLHGTPEPELRPTPGELPLLAELRAFLEHLGGGPPPASSARDGALIVRRMAELGALAELPVLPDGVRLRALEAHADARGTFAELHRGEWDTGVAPVQWNAVRSEAGVLRGVHVHPRHDDYLVVYEGRATVGLRDLRGGDPQPCCVELDGAEPTAITIPHGVAHGFYFHAPSVHIYAVSHYWDTADELGCHWADAELGIPWPMADAVVSERDAALPSLAELQRRLDG